MSQCFVPICMIRICIIVSFEFDVSEDLSRFRRHCFPLHCEETQNGIYLPVFRSVSIKVFIVYLFNTISVIWHKCSVCPYESTAQEYCCLRIGPLHNIRTQTDKHTVDS